MVRNLLHRARRLARQTAQLGLVCLGSSPAAHATIELLGFLEEGIIENPQLLAPATLEIKAFATDTQGIQKVEFFADATLLGEGIYIEADYSRYNKEIGSVGVYTLAIPGIGAGTYGIWARLTDNEGNRQETAPKVLTVNDARVYGTPGVITPVPFRTSPAPYGYNEYLPAGYDPEDSAKRWPLVISLHGAGGQPGVNSKTGEINVNKLDQAVEGVMRAIVMDGIKLPAVVLQPQADNDLVKWNDVNAFITYALAQYNVDADRVYLTGHSWGANIGALTYAGGRTNGVNHADRLAALFPMCGGSYSANKTKGDRMANLPIWNFASWGDHIGASLGVINSVNYAAGGMTYQDEIDAKLLNPDFVAPIRDLLFSFSTVGYETTLPSVNDPDYRADQVLLSAPLDPSVVAGMTTPAFIPTKRDAIDELRTVSFVDGEWVWNENKVRDPDGTFFITLLPSSDHVIWPEQYALADLWTWVFCQTRSPRPRIIFEAARFSTTAAVVNQAYVATLASKVTAPRGASFARDGAGPAWLKVAPDGTLSGTPGVSDLGLNTWDIAVNTTDDNNLPIGETAELLIFVEAPGYNSWWQKQNGYAELNISKIQTGPAGDDDRDGLSNYFEHTANTDPLLASSRFNVSIAPASENPAQLAITFGPLIRRQTYTVKANDSLTSESWLPVETITPSSNQESVTVTIIPSTASSQFYRVEISKH